MNLSSVSYYICFAYTTLHLSSARHVASDGLVRGLNKFHGIAAANGGTFSHNLLLQGDWLLGAGLSLTRLFLRTGFTQLLLHILLLLTLALGTLKIVSFVMHESAATQEGISDKKEQNGKGGMRVEKETNGHTHHHQ